MTFQEQLAITLLDKLLIGGLLLFAGFLLNVILEKRKANDELKKAVALERVKAYQVLWAISIKSVDQAAKSERRQDFGKWYNEGGALFLSFNAARRFFEATKLLRDDHDNVREIQSVLSLLRTKLKHDCGTYGRKEADSQIPEAGKQVST